MALPINFIKNYSSFSKKQVAGLLVSLVSLLILPVILFAAYKTVSPYIKAAPESIPKRVVISNLNSQGLSVSWVSDAQTTGYLTYLQGTATNTKADDRASNSLTYVANSRTHHVSLQLSPRPADGKIKFKINSGTKAYGGSIETPAEGGDYITVDLPTAPSVLGATSTEANANQDFFRPHPIWGTATGENGPGALVYAKVVSGTGATKSNILSSISDNNGKWVMDIANALQKDNLGAYLSYITDAVGSSADKISVTYRSLDQETTNDSSVLHSVVDLNSATMNRPSPIEFTLAGGGTEPPTPPGENTAPIARLAVTPSTAKVNEQFSADASASTDTETAAASLEVRFDWEGDGTWDTTFSTTKTVTHAYTTTGTKTIKVEVKDAGGLTATATGGVVVEEEIPADHHKLNVDFSLQGMSPLGSENRIRSVALSLASTSGDDLYDLNKFCSFSNNTVCRITLDLEAASVDLTKEYRVIVKPEGYLQKIISEQVEFSSLVTTVGDSNTTVKVGDYTEDNKIKLDDITKFLSVFSDISVPLANQEDSKKVYDVNGDGIINVVDLSIVLSNYTALEVAGDE